jgi:hypothetical protein
VKATNGVYEELWLAEIREARAVQPARWLDRTTDQTNLGHWQPDGAGKYGDGRFRRCETPRDVGAALMPCDLSATHRGRAQAA